MATALAAMLFVLMSFQPAAASLCIAQDDSAPVVFASPRATTWSGLRSTPRSATLFALGCSRCVFARSD